MSSTEAKLQIMSRCYQEAELQKVTTVFACARGYSCARAVSDSFT
jgi:hypothetical protein